MILFHLARPSAKPLFLRFTAFDMLSILKFNVAATDHKIKAYCGSCRRQGTYYFGCEDRTAVAS